MNDLMPETGIEDSRDAALAYLRYTGGGQNRSEYMATYVDNAARVLTYLHQHAHVQCRQLDLAELHVGLVHAFELSTSLGALHQAMSYMWILMNVAEDARWELEHGLVTWLRRLLQLLPPGNSPSTP